MSQYLILIYEDETSNHEGGEPVTTEVMAEHQKFWESYGEKSIAGGNALQSPSTATTIRTNSSGDFVVTDGPFAETKEALGGYYLVEAADLDEAISIAKAVPARFGGVEIRPIQTFG